MNHKVEHCIFSKKGRNLMILRSFAEDQVTSVGRKGHAVHVHYVISQTSFGLHWPEYGFHTKTFFRKEANGS